MQFLKSSFRQILLTAVVYALVGLFFIISPHTAFITIGRIIAAGMLIIGIIKIIFYLSEENYSGFQRNTMTSGIILAIMGIFMFIKPETAGSISGYILAFVIMAAGITKFQYAADMNHFKVGNPLIVILLGITEIILGSIAFIDPFTASETFLIMIGISMMITAVGDVIVLLNIYKTMKILGSNIIEQ